MKWFRREFIRRRCNTCQLAAQSPWLGWGTKRCKCEWNDEVERYAKMESYGMAHSVWGNNTFKAPPDSVLVMNEKQRI